METGNINKQVNKYNCKFIGRLRNAQGISYLHELQVEAETADGAHFKLYDTHENIMRFQITNVSDPKDYKSNKMIH
jgi:hypothetical protein